MFTPETVLMAADYRGMRYCNRAENSESYFELQDVLNIDPLIQIKKEVKIQE
jgi:hypothetical protein